MTAPPWCQVFAAIPYCIDLIGGPYAETRPEVIAAFRPKSARARSLSGRCGIVFDLPINPF